ncbi:MAG: nucleoside 2-deoxyribosyltransferase [Desulfobacteraceae bacterium]|nr:nucleoside 2-deoxyribosyltransferase [Desulfobacteraceae bacterium]
MSKLGGTTSLRIYLAGPDVFLANALEIGERKKEWCRRFGFEGLFPIDPQDTDAAEPAKTFTGNYALMDRADIGLFNLTPFRGPSADAGTIFELGVLFAKGKPVYGYANTREIYRERVDRLFGPIVDRDGRPWGRDGYAVEDFGLTDNLMIVRAIEEAGGSISVVEERTTEGLETEGKQAEKDKFLAAFGAFKTCLEKVESDVRTDPQRFRRRVEPVE